ncbi:MAG: NUDIX hydrolase [Dehalococcoidales bacterium]|nr:NUDIX hydrolase [Dehalococcoidales bacterium]
MTEKTLSSKTVFTGRAIRVRVDTVRTVDGRMSSREIVEHAPCIAVIPVNENGEVLLVRQFRKAVEKELLEIPAGGIDEGEDPETAVTREMREEIGMRPQRLLRLGGFYSSPGYSSEYLHLYLATDLVPDPLSAEDTAGITIVPVRPEGIPEMIASGRIEDGKTIAGLLYYLAYHRG